MALGECGEGMTWARGLVADCWYRIAVCHERSRRRKLALKAFEQHLRLRGPGCRSIYPIAEVRHKQRALLRKGRLRSRTVPGLPRIMEAVRYSNELQFESTRSSIAA